MQHHPIPQNVTSYQFRLIGPMTIKQFGELAGGLLLAWITFKTPLPFFIKYPLTAIFGFGGAALAFLPVEGLPLDRWLLAFFKSIYTPTLFIWQKSSHAKQGEDHAITKKIPSTSPKFMDKLDKLEMNLLHRFQNLVQSPSTPLPLQKPDVQHSQHSSIPKSPPVTPPPIMPPSPTIKPILPKTQPPKIVFERGLGTQTPFVKQLHKKQLNQPTSPAKRSSVDLPDKPEQPNLLIGLVLDSQGHLVDNAILEIRRVENQAPVRVLKTDLLGKFFTTTPLENGQYHLLVEKQGLNFDIVNIELKGEILAPIEIKALKIKNSKIK